MKTILTLKTFATIGLLCLLAMGCKEKPKTFRIGILQWTQQVEPFNKTHRGVMEGLNDRGYREGVNIETIFRNAEQNNDSALKIAREFVEQKVALIVALGTGSALAALKATEKNQTPIVFSIVGAPKATGIIDSYTDSGRNITGVSMKVPIKEQFDMVSECLPKLKTIGILYCTKMPQAVATGKEGLSVARVYGWLPVEIPILPETLPQLEKKLDAVIKTLDAVYIPTDPILGAPEHLEKVIAVLDTHRIPLISVAERYIEQGALMALNCDFYEIGRQAAEQIEEVLIGVPIRKISIQEPTLKRLSINLKKAKLLGLEINRNCILRADKIYD